MNFTNLKDIAHKIDNIMKSFEKFVKEEKGEIYYDAIGDLLKELNEIEVETEKCLIEAKNTSSESKHRQISETFKELTIAVQSLRRDNSSVGNTTEEKLAHLMREVEDAMDESLVISKSRGSAEVRNLFKQVADIFNEPPSGKADVEVDECDQLIAAFNTLNTKPEVKYEKDLMISPATLLREFEPYLKK